MYNHLKERSLKHNSLVPQGERAEHYYVRRVTRNFSRKRRNRSKDLDIPSADEEVKRRSAEKQQAVTNTERGLLIIEPEAQAITVPMKNKNKGQLAEKKETKKPRKVKEETLTTRGSLRTLKDMIGSMEPLQKQLVTDMGFGSFLELDIEEIPGNLSLWLVQNYEPSLGMISLPNRKGLKLTTEDVHKYLGLPMGPKTIREPSKEDFSVEQSDKASNSVKAWKSQFDKDAVQINKVVKAALQCSKEENDNFIRNFLVILNFVVFESTKNGSMTTKILNSVTELDEVKNYNWCSYLFEKMNTNVLEWQNSGETKTIYNGPILFIALAYLDRVIVFEKIPQRTSFPIMNCWKKQDVKDRMELEEKAKGFGKGWTREPPNLEEIKKEEGKNTSRNITEKDGVILYKGQDFETFIRNKAITGLEVANKINAHLTDMIELPSAWTENETLKRLDAEYMTFLNPKSRTPSQRSQINVSQDNMDVFWNNPAVIDFVNAVSKTKELAETYNQGVPAEPESPIDMPVDVPKVGGAKATIIDGTEASKVGEAEASTFDGAEASTFGSAEASKEGGAEASKDGGTFDGAEASTFGSAKASKDGGAEASMSEMMFPPNTTIEREESPTPFVISQVLLELGQIQRIDAPHEKRVQRKMISPMMTILQKRMKKRLNYQRLKIKKR